jgi:hypothetical protein
MSSLTIKRGDTSPTQTVRLVDRDGQPANLTGATVVMRVQDGTDLPCEIVGAAAGEVRFLRNGLDPSPRNVRTWQVEFEVTYSDQTVQTFPEASYMRLQVWADLDEVTP